MKEWSNQHSRSSGVYPRCFMCVKSAVGNRVVVAALLLAISGHQSLGQTPALGDGLIRKPVPVGVRYSLATALSVSDASLELALARDFAGIAKAGANAVFVSHADEDFIPTVLATGERFDLSVVIEDSLAIRYLQTGDGVEEADGGILSGKNLIPRQPSVLAHYLGHIVDDVTEQRARAVCELAKAASPPVKTCVTVHAPYEIDEKDAFDFVISAGRSKVQRGRRHLQLEIPAASIMTINCLQHRSDEETTVREWLRQYHMGLLEGRTGGVVFNRYRSLPGKWDGIVVGDRPMTPERTAMLKRIALRANRWGDLLKGLPAESLEGLHWERPELKGALFRDSSRSCLLIVNGSTTGFVRASVRLPARMAGKSIRRAVCVPPTDDMPLGEVHPVRRGELIIPVDFAPGEACLYELF